MADGADTHHGTAVALGEAAALIVGPPGAGKSDLALRCLALAPTPLLPHAAVLVADDRVVIEAAGGRLRLTVPEAIRGKLEVRGLGILEVPCRPSADLRLIVELVAPEAVERLPDPPPQRDFGGVRVPILRVFPFEVSAAPKLLLALALAAGGPGNPHET